MKIQFVQNVRSIPFSFQTREKIISQLEKTKYDICIIGGGISGAGIARDASLRRLKTLLVEKSDFAAGTSSKSSKLIHGGFRYLKQYQFGLVREALVERYKLLHLAPHLVSKLPTIFPIYEESDDSYWKIKAGMTLYDWLCGFKRIGTHKMHRGRQLLNLVPELNKTNLAGGAEYFDAKADDSRLVMATLQSAVQSGCDAISYFRVAGFEKQNGITKVLYGHDEIKGGKYNIRAKVFVNATGAWGDITRRLNNEVINPRIRTTKGIHLVVPKNRLNLNYAVMLISTLDGRPLFAVPWREFVLLGTTDSDFDGDLDLIYSTMEDADYLLDSFNSVFPDIKLTENDVISSYAGVRPLVFEEGKSTSKISREHEIFESPKNLYNLIGGKLTTYRKMSADLIDIILKVNEFSVPNRCLTDKFPLYGSEIESYEQNSLELKKTLVEDFSLTEDDAMYLLSAYGCHVKSLFNYLKDSSQNSESIIRGLPFIWAQLYYAIDYEMTISLDDFLIRRTHIFSLDWDQGTQIVGKCADIMGKTLQWNEDEKQKQIEKYLYKVDLSRKFRRIKKISRN